MLTSLKSFLEGVFKLDPHSCWSLPPKMQDRRIRSGGSNISTARYLYEVLFAPVPPDRVLFRRCRTKDCCNPNHMNLVKNRGPLMRLAKKRGGSPAALIEASLDLQTNVHDCLEFWDDFPPAPKTLLNLLDRLHQSGLTTLTERALTKFLAENHDLKNQLTD